MEQVPAISLTESVTANGRSKRFRKIQCQLNPAGDEAMKIHNRKNIIYSHSRVLLTCFFLMLPAANCRPECLLHRYWPMNDGDDTYYTNSSLGGCEDAFRSTGGGFILEQTTPDGAGGTSTGDAYLSYSTDQLLVSELSAVGYDILFDSDLILLNEGILKNGGSVSSSSTGTIAWYGSFNITLTASASKVGTVTVPAGSYTNCVSLSWTLTISANGQSAQIPFNVFVLAPGVGVIRQALYSYSGTTVTQVGWADLTSGQVGGVPVANLAALSGLTIPEFTLQPRSTVATNNGIAIFRAAATGNSVQYRWQKNGDDLDNGANISGATSSNLVINPVHYSDQGLYSVMIVNPVCSSSSTGAVLSVIADPVRPTVSIQSPVSNSNVSNAIVQVTGKAADNIGVDRVNVWVDSATPITATGTTNWLASCTLTAGPHTIFAQSFDLENNASPVASNKVTYVVSAVLTVHTNGNGTISPNYNGVLLQIGKSYSITATAGTGFMFTNWTGSIATNTATLQFTMASNLTFAANFVDVTRPTLSITNLASGQRVSNAVFTVRGTATDNWQVSNVWYQLNGVAWSNALTANVWSNWSGVVTLFPGTNVVQAFAMDTTGNKSTTNSVSFQLVVTNQLRVRAIGLGTISPNYSNAWLELGRNYSLAATPGSGFNFTNWVISTNWLGGVTTNNATVQFMMKSNLTLQVSFVDVTRPTLTITAPTADQHMTNALANVKGTASDNWRVNNVWYQLNSNAWSLATSTNGWTNWTVTLTLVAGTNTVKAYAVDWGANLSATNSVSFVSSNTFTLQLGFAAGQSLTTDGLGFDLQISPGLNGRVEASTDLVSWLTLTNFVGSNATLHFRDATATNLNQRFYRAVTP